VQLTKGKPELVLFHTIKNTGKKPIETNVMNHNFFVIDSQVTSSHFEINFPFEPIVEESNEPKAAVIQGKQILLKTVIPKGKNFYLGPSPVTHKMQMITTLPSEIKRPVLR
jgi:hypothetical protein